MWYYVKGYKIKKRKENGRTAEKVVFFLKYFYLIFKAVKI